MRAYRRSILKVALEVQILAVVQSVPGLKIYLSYGKQCAFAEEVRNVSKCAFDVSVR